MSYIMAQTQRRFHREKGEPPLEPSSEDGCPGLSPVHIPLCASIQYLLRRRMMGLEVMEISTCLHDNGGFGEEGICPDRHWTCLTCSRSAHLTAATTAVHRSRMHGPLFRPVSAFLLLLLSNHWAHFMHFHGLGALARRTDPRGELT